MSVFDKSDYVPTLEDKELVKAILTAYHTTRFSDVDPVDHILGKFWVTDKLIAVKKDYLNETTTNV